MIVRYPESGKIEVVDLLSLCKHTLYVAEYLVAASPAVKQQYGLALSCHLNVYVYVVVTVCHFLCAWLFACEDNYLYLKISK